jgi:ATP-dependent Lon protease
MVGKEEVIIYERSIDGKIMMLKQEEIKKLEEINKKSKRKIIIPLKRSNFVQASGGTETELLGDIRHDPYGGHQNLGTAAYQRVVPGAVHDSHEGVLFIDELSTLGDIQRHILTAMQDKMFPVVGRNPMSSGAAVRVEGVPCDFIFVGACNINDLKHIIPPLRSRIRGDGYEVLMNAYMDDTPENEQKICQFIAQEIMKDGKIPHADREAVMLILEEARVIAKRIDNAKGLTLRLRNLAGIIKMAGDMAITEKKEFIEKKHVERAIKEARPIEEKIKEKYGNWWSAQAADYGMENERAGPETA